MCGGIGYLFENRFGTLREDVDIFTTFEGANPVLQQLVAKGLLSDYKEQFGELRVWSVIKFMTARASVAVAEQNPITKRRTESEHLRDPEFHAAAFRFREQRLLSTVARRLKARLDDGLDSFAAMNACQDHLITLAEAHAEHTIYQSFRTRIDTLPANLQAMLEPVLTLYALSTIEKNRAWFLESDYMETPKTKAIRNEVTTMCEELMPFTVPLVEAIGIPDSIARRPSQRRSNREPLPVPGYPGRLPVRNRYRIRSPSAGEGKMMMSLMELWLPILLSTILIFVASAVMWMVMPHHRTDWQSMPNGERVQELLKGVPPGQYIYPGLMEPEERKDKEAQKRYQAGMGFVIVREPKIEMGKQMGSSVLHSLVVCTLVAYLAASTIRQARLI